jgi:hypothetical protein
MVASKLFQGVLVRKMNTLSKPTIGPIVGRRMTPRIPNIKTYATGGPTGKGIPTQGFSWTAYIASGVAGIVTGLVILGPEYEKRSTNPK